MDFDLAEGRAFKIPALLSVPLVVAYLGAYQLSHETIEITVEDKNTVHDQNSRPQDGYTPHNWMVYTAGEVFTVTNDWTQGEFLAAERYHELKVGQTYRVKVAGWRVPLFNWYRNVVRIESSATG